MRRLSLVLGGALVALMVVPTAAGATPPGPPIHSTDSRYVHFSGRVFDAATNESVDVVGNVNLVTTVDGSNVAGWTVTLRSSLSNTFGRGQSSGATYTVTGSKADSIQTPPGPPTHASFQPSFDMFPPGPNHPPNPCRLSVGISFNPDASVSTVSVAVGALT